MAAKKKTTLTIPSGDITKAVVSSQAQAVIQSGRSFEELCVITKYLAELSTKMKDELNEVYRSGKFKIDEPIKISGFTISKRKTSTLIDFKDTPTTAKMKQNIKDVESGLKVDKFALKQAVAEQVDKGNGKMDEKYSVIIIFPK